MGRSSAISSRPLDGQLEDASADYTSSHPTSKYSTIASRMPVLQARQSEGQSSLIARMVDVAVETTPWPHPSHDIPAPVAPLVPGRDSEELFRPLGGNTPKAHTCSLCQQVFRRPYLLRDHMVSRHGSVVSDGSYPCDYPGCGLKYTTHSNMMRHRQRAHTRVDSIHIGSEVVPSPDDMVLEPLHATGEEYLDMLFPKYARASRRARGILAAHRDREPSNSTSDISKTRGATSTTEADPQARIAKPQGGTRSVGGTQDEHTSPTGPAERLASHVTPAPVSQERTASPMETTPAIEGTSDHSDEEVTSVWDTGPNVATIVSDASVSDSGSGPGASTSVLSSVGCQTLIANTFATSVVNAATYEPAVRVPVPTLCHVCVSPTDRPRSPRSLRSGSPPRVDTIRTLCGGPYLPGDIYGFGPTQAFSSSFTPRGDGGNIWSGQGPGRSINISSWGVSELSRISEQLLGSDLPRSSSNAHANRSTSEQLVHPLGDIDAIYREAFSEGFSAGFSLATSQSSGPARAQPTSSFLQAGSTGKESARAGEATDSLRSSQLPVPPTLDATQPIIPAETTRIWPLPDRVSLFRSLLRLLIGADEPQPAQSASRPPVAPTPQSNQAGTSLNPDAPTVASEAFDETMSQSCAPPTPPHATVLEHPGPCSQTLGASIDPTNNTPAPDLESESDTQNADNHHNLGPSQPVAPVDIASSLPPAPEPPPSLVQAVPYPSLPTRAATPVTQGENNRPHVCAVCGKAYGRPYLLRDHMKSKHIDTTDKPYGCDFEGCKSRFSTRSNVRKHFNYKHRASGTPHGDDTN